MAILNKIDKSDKLTITFEGKKISVVKKEIIDNFNPDILELGKIDTKSKQINALSVIFDLEGFTRFCNQIDPHLAVPEYLSEFLNWIFTEIRKEIIEKSYEQGYAVWSELPFFSKYLGDGLLFLWDTENMHENSINNVVISMYEVCNKYRNEFFPEISKKIISPPPILRCGIARGIVYTVGIGKDFVGPCINMSARLQKLHSLSFCFSRRGIDPHKMEGDYNKEFTIKKVNIRGIGENELVCFSNEEFIKLPSLDKSNFRDV